MQQVAKWKRKLGVGGRCVVYEGFDPAMGRFVAIKEVLCVPHEPSPSTQSHREDGEEGAGPSPAASENLVAEQVAAEARLMSGIQHPHLVEYYGLRRCEVGLQLIMEHVGGGSLDRVLAKCGPLSEAVARRYVQDLLQGLAFLHEQHHICHRDVKPANILLTSGGRCKLTDFGVATRVRTKDGGRDSAEEAVSFLKSSAFMHTAVGTPWYMAPEVISGGIDSDEDEDEDDRGKEEGNIPDSSVHASQKSDEDGEELLPSHYYNPLKRLLRHGRRAAGPSHSPSAGHTGYGTSADVWSLGVTLYEMLANTKPFGANVHNPSAVLFCIVNSASSPPRLPSAVAATVSAEVQQFLELCFVYDPGLRPTARELLSHPWVTQRDGRGSGVPRQKRLSDGVERRPRAVPSLFEGMLLLDTLDLPQVASRPVSAVAGSSYSSVSAQGSSSTGHHGGRSPISPDQQRAMQRYSIVREKIAQQSQHTEEEGPEMPLPQPPPSMLLPGAPGRDRGGFTNKDGLYIDLLSHP